jgi:hypothetical protein
MLMRDDHRIDAIRLFPDGRKAFRKFPKAEADVDQHTRFFGGDERAVSGTAARKHAELDDSRVPLERPIEQGGAV